MDEQEEREQRARDRATEALQADNLRTRGLCPRCGDKLQQPEVRNALSRVDNKTYICNGCGDQEAMADMIGHPLPPVDRVVWL
jgi:predicted RNA-binding Zn-ribbon protein involved in translation (DUF1610 family)